MLVLIFVMAAFQPVFLLVGFVFSLVYSVLIKGWQKTLQSLSWQLPLILIIALVNPLFSQIGSTELFSFGQHAYYAESFLYGASMGLMLATMIIWLSVCSHVMTSDKTYALLGAHLPVLGTTISMITRLIPQMVRRGRETAEVLTACTAAHSPAQATVCVVDDACTNSTGEKTSHAQAGKGSRKTIHLYLTVFTSLMGWSMEDSLETSHSLLAKGWGATSKRTSYNHYEIHKHDVAALVVIVVCAAACAVCAWYACSEFCFYPTIQGWVPWYFYCAYVVFLALPALVVLRGTQVG